MLISLALVPTLTAALAAVVPEPAPAPRPPAVGETVRVRARSGEGRWTGVVEALDGDDLTVSLGAGRSVRIPIRSIDRLEVARGKRRAAREGALVGGAAGFVLGGVAVAGLVHALCEVPNCAVDPLAFLIGGGVGAVPAAGVGALVGLAFEKDRWQRIPRERLQARVVPVRGGVGLQLAVGFGRR